MKNVDFDPNQLILLVNPAGRKSDAMDMKTAQPDNPGSLTGYTRD